METIEKTIQYTPEDLQLAYTTHFRKIYPVRSRLLLIVSAISFVAGSVLLVYELIKGTTGYTNWAAWFLIAYGAIILILYFTNLRNVGKRMYSKMPDFEKPFNYVFSEEKIQVTSENVNNTNKWEFYQSALICPDVIMVYPNKFRFNLFPRKYFTNEEFETLILWIKAKVKTKETK